MTMQKDLTNIRKAWDKILKSLENKGADIQTWSKRDGDGDYFHVNAVGEEIIATRSEKVPSCQIESNRPINYQQFERVAKVFNQYIKGDVQRGEMRKLGWNTSYIIALIVRFL